MFGFICIPFFSFLFLSKRKWGSLIKYSLLGALQKVNVTSLWHIQRSLCRVHSHSQRDTKNVPRVCPPRATFQDPSTQLNVNLKMLLDTQRHLASCTLTELRLVLCTTAVMQELVSNGEFFCFNLQLFYLCYTKWSPAARKHRKLLI